VIKNENYFFSGSLSTSSLVVPEWFSVVFPGNLLVEVPGKVIHGAVVLICGTGGFGAVHHANARNREPCRRKNNLTDSLDVKY